MRPQRFIPPRIGVPVRQIPLVEWARTPPHSVLQEILALISDPEILSFAVGMASPELLPRQSLAEAAVRVLAEDENALQYGIPSGSIRSHIVRLMKGRGVECAGEQILLTTGAQQAMSLLVSLLLEPGGRVILEETVYEIFQMIVRPLSPRVLTVPADSKSGMDVDQVESRLLGGARPAFLYSITDGHNPLGVSLPIEKRRKLARLARDHGVPIIEDDAYGYLRYDGAGLPPLKALEPDWVCYVGTFSKILAPGLRVGWVVLPESLVEPFAAAKHASDLNSATLSQRLLAAWLDRGELPAHLESLQRIYRDRRDRMVAALRRHFPPEAQWHEPENGLFIWVDLPQSIDTTELLKVAVTNEKVAFVPGRAFSVNGKGPGGHGLRLCFANCPAERIDEGIARLGRVIGRALA